MELWDLQAELWKHAFKVVREEKGIKATVAPPLGSVYKIRFDHPLEALIREEQHRRCDERERNDPESYWGMYYHYDFSHEEAWDFIEWCWKKHPGCDKHDLKSHVEMWRKERRKYLPVLPTKSLLPSNGNGVHGGIEEPNRGLPDSGSRYDSGRRALDLRARGLQAPEGQNPPPPSRPSEASQAAQAQG